MFMQNQTSNNAKIKEFFILPIVKYRLNKKCFKLPVLCLKSGILKTANFTPCFTDIKKISGKMIYKKQSKQSNINVNIVYNPYFDLEHKKKRLIELNQSIPLSAI